jgi:hypothetical protein
MTMSILSTCQQPQNMVTKLAAFLLLMLVLVGCANRTDPPPTGFTPHTTRLPAQGTSPAWDADENMPVVMVRINGEGPYRFLIDTGASHVIVDKRLAERLRLPRQGSAAAAWTAANAYVDTEQPAVITSLDVGDAHFTDFTADVFDLTRMEIDGDLPIPIDGFLGAALFSHTLLTIDYPQRSIHIANGSLPEVNGSTILPLVVEGYLPSVPLQLGTLDQVQTRLALIDTGSGDSLNVGTEWGLTYSTPTIDGRQSMTASGLVSNRYARIERLRLGDLCFVGPTVSIRDDQRYPLIGQGLLSNMRLTLDLASRRVHFEASQRTFVAGPSRSYGFTARPCRRPGREGSIVNWIAKDSPAAKSLQLGDHLITVNGQSTAHMSNRTFTDIYLNAASLTLVRATMPEPVSLAVFDQLPWTPRDGHPSGAPERSRAFALWSLGWAYSNGFGALKDESKALLCDQQAAELHDAAAQTAVGGRMLMGHLLPKDPAGALAWLRKAADQGYPLAQRILGQMYAHGYGVPKDEVQACTWFMKAAKQGDADAQKYLARMYEKGLGIPADPTAAFAWRMKAAKQGDAEAQAKLGWLYFSGLGVEKDLAQARAWSLKAAEQGDQHAQYNLGGFYAKGQGGDKDVVQARRWLQAAAQQDHLEAKLYLDSLAKPDQTVP